MSKRTLRTPQVILSIIGRDGRYTYDRYHANRTEREAVEHLRTKGYININKVKKDYWLLTSRKADEEKAIREALTAARGATG